jgi:hypothetical protein
MPIIAVLRERPSPENVTSHHLCHGIFKSVFGAAIQIAPFRDDTTRVDPFNWPDAFMWLLFDNGALKLSSF